MKGERLTPEQEALLAKEGFHGLLDHGTELHAFEIAPADLALLMDFDVGVGTLGFTEDNELFDETMIMFTHKVAFPTAASREDEDRLVILSRKQAVLLVMQLVAMINSDAHQKR